ncbi:TrlF family AAA-like ATPase [Acinetobacter baumannii]|uniref:TrlF family AAA-like ATPase n=1 Tax=Acinetobacter nosocomialis TaxID=106654 RepID=UPI001AEA898A|nr:AAA family ATPase [Acinetobacter nosocomialis]MBP1486981.1 AAA family ATPase [Acinetobacter nosocomialis]MBP1496452.1 AAA family ATPase [Acinetobacter nosocomialis]
MLEQQNYKKARFFKCALQVNPVGYIQYRGQEQSLSEAEYNQQLLNAALEAGVEVIGLADHGSVDQIDALRKLFNQNGIVVFPGFEIASSEKIHFVCLFDESKTCQELERILGRLDLLDPEDGILPTNLSSSQLIDKVNEIGGFIYAAHCTNDDGVLKRRMNHVWQHKGLLAAQIPSSIEDLRGIENDFYRKVFLNKDPNYCREREMAAINAADVAKPTDIQADGASCLIKMTKPCFASFRQAFLDAGSRVRLNSDKPESYASAIEKIRFVGGYLDGLDIELSDHLNAVIGGRGTGKSTLLECIRYAFDLEPKTQNALKQHKSVIESNLGKERGMVEITLRSATMHGRRFTISRKYGNQPVVVDEQGNISPYHPADLLPDLELYGQNEIYEMTRDEASRNHLIERFLEGEHQHFDADITKVFVKLKENRESINRALNQKDDIEAEVERLPKLQEQAKQFQALGIEEKLKVIPKLEKEKQLNERVNDDITRVKTAIETLKDSLPDTIFISDASLEGLPHADLLKQQRGILETLKLDLTQQLGQLEQLASTTTTQLLPIQQMLAEKQQAEEQKLENAFKEIPASQGKTGLQIGAEYQALLKQIEQIRPKQVTLQNRKMQIDGLYNQRKLLLLELDQHTTARASSMQRSVKRLNRKLDQKVKLTLRPEGNRQRLVDFLNTCSLDGVGPKRLAWVLEQVFLPANLAATIRQGETELVRKFSIPDSVVRALIHLPEQKLLEIEELLLPDTMTIELNVTHGERDAIFRPIDDLSTGQQCTAVLHLLLLDNQDPLILDQPEDNLDNAFIAERIVAELRRAKLSRQFLFATHNANIPVFGDAEWIGVLSVQDNKGMILPEQQGAIDVPRVQELAADILEGGKSAFNQRREKYGFN